MSSTTLQRCTLLVCGLMLTSALPLTAQAFQHPGVLLSRAQLEFMKAEVNAGVEPFRTEFQRAKDSEYGDLNYKPKGPPATGVIECGSSSHPDFGCKDEDADSAAAYVQSLLWTITGNPAYAKNAIQIMNAYGHNLTPTPIPTRRCNRHGAQPSGPAQPRSFATAMLDGLRRTSRTSPTC